MNNKKARLIVNIGMVLLLPLLMAYSLIGEKFHEIIGTVMTVLIVIHLIQNRQWLGAIFKGRYNVRRTFQTILDILLLVFMVLQPVSGILMSKHLYTFIQVPGVSSIMRQIHMALAYWGFVLMSIHAGTHQVAPMKRLFIKNGKVFAALLVGLGCISTCGVTAFMKRGFPGYMSGSVAFAFFDFSEVRLFFILDYLAIMILFMSFGGLAVYVLSKITRKGKAEEK
ncbi:MAG: DUF4405 domain-containing protein [Lachnospiraceae bacterium]|nr:DUF4405 domain-containing protein [Lachnospiraceae bacterium]